MMASRLRYVVSGAIIAALSTPLVAKPICTFKRATIVNSRAAMGGSVLTLAEPNDAGHPTAWQGPATVTTGRSRCALAADVAIIEAPIFFSPTSVIVSTYSGSHKTAYLVSLQSCATVWHSQPYIAALTATGRTIRIGRARYRVDPSCLKIAR